ncbi:MAG: metallophosphoesterase [Bacteroidales bacterium]|jgi:exonuclease SbcD|nr:metallophosphoesterase family protein [Bacteroidales bacterium]MDI9575337.1 metallophosphoesterase family protein [Bacteroidota bacterium]MDD2593549.1 metallophosphoesterase family protein [Bacteroidales bacterium]MDD3756387.1 metallophosphoesterase family protein [Bacteroidales bacterium]MDY0401636.1 metallophosphoesterase family protein [Bacteroidales bacterium]
MKIGITADLHLKNANETKERYEALNQILNILQNQDISHLVIAGDLFDKDVYNYNDFEKLCQNYSNINFHIIPGNHDAALDKRYFSLPNINVYSEITIKKFDNISFLFLPYRLSGTMDEALINYFNNYNLTDKWILVGHGDYLDISKSADEYEKGYYMPLSRNIINELEPLRVFLGHIHKAYTKDKITYPGSPYPLDINETGKRKFLIYNTENDNIEDVYLDIDKIYMVEELLIIPTNNEIDDAINKIDNLINNWNFNDVELNKVILRLILKGFTSDKNALIHNITQHIVSKNIKFYDNNLPRDENLNVVKDPDREFIMKNILEKIDNINYDFVFSEKQDVIEQALNLIYKD